MWTWEAARSSVEAGTGQRMEYTSCAVSLQSSPRAWLAALGRTLLVEFCVRGLESESSRAGPGGAASLRTELMYIFYQCLNQMMMCISIWMREGFPFSSVHLHSQYVTAVQSCSFSIFFFFFYFFGKHQGRAFPSLPLCSFWSISDTNSQLSKYFHNVGMSFLW